MSMPRMSLDPTDRLFHPSQEETAAWAGHWHAGQVDKAGKPYVGHLIRVSRHLVRLFPSASRAERHAAWLHDVLEDTAMTAEDLRRMSYAPEVIAIVEAVTKPGTGNETYADWIDRLAQDAPLGALRVKLADLTDNSDPDRLAALPPERAASLETRYRAAIRRLQEALERRTNAVLDEADPRGPDLIPLTLALEPVDFWVLGEAAKIADRSAEGFAEEEAMDLAHRIIATNSLRHVDLARDRRAKDAVVMEPFSASVHQQEVDLPAPPPEDTT